MVAINYANREVSCKIVYYGPGLSGKTTNLQYIHGKVPGTTRGDLISLATDADRTLYFDFLPINIGTINGFTTRFQLYTVPGQVFYNATRKLVLRGVDGLIFVADSQRDKADENVESLNNLKENLDEYGYDLDDLPLILQYNKRDLPDIMSVEELDQLLNTHNWPVFESVAHKGTGVFDTLKLIIKMILAKARKSGAAKKIEEAQVDQPAAAAQQPQQPEPQPAQENKPLPSDPQTDKINVRPAAQNQPRPAEQRPAAKTPEHVSRPVSNPAQEQRLAASAEGQSSTSTAVADKPINHSEIESLTESSINDPDVDTRLEPQSRAFEENVIGENEPERKKKEAPQEGAEEDMQGRQAGHEYEISDDDTEISQPETAETEPEEAPQSSDEDQDSDADGDSEDPFALPSNKPKMAEPMKVRNKKKKRGFFSRLFGRK